MEALICIKRLVIARHVLFTEKAECEMAADELTPELVYEAILNAPAVFKRLRSRNESKDWKVRIPIHHQGPNI